MKNPLAKHNIVDYNRMCDQMYHTSQYKNLLERIDREISDIDTKIGLAYLAGRISDTTVFGMNLDEHTLKVREKILTHEPKKQTLGFGLFFRYYDFRNTKRELLIADYIYQKLSKTDRKMFETLFKKLGDTSFRDCLEAIMDLKI